MVQIDDFTAQMLLNIYSDILNIDARMSCSAEGFRRHFMLLVKTPPAQESFARLREALENAHITDD